MAKRKKNNRYQASSHKKAPSTWIAINQTLTAGEDL